MEVTYEKNHDNSITGYPSIEENGTGIPIVSRVKFYHRIRARSGMEPPTN